MSASLTQVLLDGRPTNLYGCCIGLKGDWPALTKLGELIRHHGRESHVKESLGICHLCKAGQRGFDFHLYDYKTMKGARTDEMPWSEPSSLTTVIPQSQTNLPKFYKIDIFHTGHKGVMGDVCANAIATCTCQEYFRCCFAASNVLFIWCWAW